MIAKLLTEHHLEFLSLKRDCRGSSESTLVKMPHCWKSHVTAQMFLSYLLPVVEYASIVCDEALNRTHKRYKRSKMTQPVSLQD